MTVPPIHRELADRLARTRVLVVGDLMLDCYYWGEARRISPEAPVPVVKVAVGEKSYRLGGSGNVAANLSGLGCKTAVMGLMGEDTASRRLRELFASFDLQDCCHVDADRPTTTKTRIMASKQQVVRVDEEDGSAVDRPTADRLLKRVADLLPSVQAVILSDYGKGMFASGDFVQAIVRSCRQAGVPVFIDPKGTDWERYAGASCVTPNTAELELVTGAGIETDDALPPLAGALRQRLSLDWLLVTRGPKGMALFGEAEAPMTIAAKAREVFDVSGAGDTVIATLAACVAAGMTFGEAASVANTAAGIVVGKLGTWAIRISELQAALISETVERPASTLWKVADLEAAGKRLDRWRRLGQRIVFTNGCFDLLHPGHVSLLHQARHLGDRLIVGLNTDASIQRLKGDRRPILPGEDRAAILSALEDVDMVVFFDEDTPLNLIDRLKPDILVKGADYRIEDVVGRSVVEAYGGQVRLVEILAGYSTTAIARKLSDSHDR
jgi:D-beta-D-heptose 7-phosphate kinase/D-beta-D-heptose 1-phosphate adenosyltransferase